MPQQYSGEAIRSDEGVPSKSYVDGWIRRIEIPQKNRIVISRPDKGLIWMLDTQAQTYSQSKLPKGIDHAFNPDTLYEWTQEGSKNIDGHRYLRFVGRPKDPEAGDAHELCFIDPKTHVRRRVIAFNKKGEQVLTIDALNVVVGPPPRHIFDMPEGYKRAYHRRKRL